MAADLECLRASREPVKPSELRAGRSTATAPRTRATSGGSGLFAVRTFGGEAIIAEKRFAGREFEQTVRELNATLIGSDRKDEKPPVSGSAG